MDSPFRPGFGKNPPFLAGRGPALEQLRMGLEIGQWPQERGILMTGLRGVGKTVMLNHAEDLAREAGWRVISETASEGFFSRIVSVHLPAMLNEVAPGPKFRVTGVEIAGLGSITVQYADGREETPTFRSMVTELLEHLGGGAGILFSIDEVNAASAEGFAVFAGEYQHLVREDREVAFVGAGVQGEVRTLLSQRSATFLRRCVNIEIGLLSFPDTIEAFRKPIFDAGRTATDEVIDYMARASQGYPFLVQSIGDIAWRSNPDAGGITLVDAERGYRLARRQMGSFIHEPALSGLSNVDRSFLAAMAHDDGPSRIGDIRSRMGGVDPGYASMYRDRLISAGLIEPAGYGRVTISFPYLREYLREHVVADAASSDTRESVGFPPPPPLD